MAPARCGHGFTLVESILVIALATMMLAILMEMFHEIDRASRQVEERTRWEASLGLFRERLSWDALCATPPGLVQAAVGGAPPASSALDLYTAAVPPAGRASLVPVVYGFDARRRQITRNGQPLGIGFFVQVFFFPLMPADPRLQVLVHGDAGTARMISLPAPASLDQGRHEHWIVHPSHCPQGGA